MNQEKLVTKLFDGKTITSPLILGSGTLVERMEQVPPFLEAGIGAVIPRTTRKTMVRDRHPSPHLYQKGRKGQEMMLNAEWTGADISYWRPHLEELAKTERLIMSISGRDISGCVEVCKELDPYDFLMLEINVSCAHSNSVHGFITRNGEHIRQLVDSLKNAGIRTPIAIKLGHSDFIVHLSSIAKESGADAIVALNTFGPLFDFEIGKGGVAVPVLGIEKGKGGMSGAPLFQIALTDVAEISRQVEIPVIACGGVSTAEQVLKMIMAGAMAVQIYTAAHVLGKRAPQLFTKLNSDLIRLLEEQEIGDLDRVRGNALIILDQATDLSIKVPDVIEDDCTGCDKCVDICLPKAFIETPSQNRAGHSVDIDHNKCVGCGHCVTVCPTDALKR